MSSAQRISLALDVLRGLAGIFMVVNHVGAQLVGRPVVGTPTGAFVFFLSSAAPVLFFFATGFAGALRPTGGGWSGRLRTVLCLEIADVLFAFGHHAAWYLDFFGFIALSALVVDAIADRRHAERWAAAGAVVLLAVRYGIAPLVTDVASQVQALAWLVGFPTTPHASYPLTPWLCFPLAGFALGRWCLRRSVAGSDWRWPAAMLALTALGGSALGIWAADQGHSMNRWGEVASGYLIASVGIVGTVIALALAATLLPPWLRRALSLRGIAAYLVVPLHYAFIAVLLDADLRLPPDLPYFAVAALLAALSLLLARRAAEAFRAVADAPALRPLATAAVAACALETWLVTPDSLAATALVWLGQLALAAWLLPLRRPAGSGLAAG